MNEGARNPKELLAWVRDNSRPILLILNAVVALALLWSVVSQGMFELRVRALMKKAVALEAKTGQSPSAGSEKKTPKKESPRSASHSRPTPQPTRPGTPSSSTQGQAVAGSPSRSGPSMSSPTLQDGQPATPTVVSGQAGRSSATTPILLVTHPGEAGTSAEVAAHAPGMTTATAESVQTAVALSAPPTSHTAVSTETVAVLNKAVARIAKSWSTFSNRLDSKPGGSVSSSRHSSKPSGSRKDDPKKELFTKLEKRALFGGARPTVHNPVFQAVLGNKAMIDNRWVGVGEKVGTWQVASITASKVVLKDEEGNEKTLSLGTGAGSGPPPPAGPMRRGRPTSSVQSESGRSGKIKPPKSEKKEMRRSGAMFDASRIPDSVLERLTRPGGPLEGISPERIKSMSRDELRELFLERRDRFRKMRERGGGPPLRGR